MNCHECEEKILLRDVLPPIEANNMKAHIAQCARCQQVMAEATAFVSKLATAREWQPTASADLTDRIMTAVIRQQQAEKPRNWLETTLFQPFARLALSGVSLAMVLFFLMEWSTPAMETKLPSPVAGMQVVLNSKAIRNVFLTPKPSRLTTCKTKTQWDVNCLKEKWKGLKF